MAGSEFDGTDFEGVDSQFFGDGSADTPSTLTSEALTMFLSTLHENALDNNVRYLRSRGSRFSHVPLIDRTSRRKITSKEWTAFDIVRFPVSPSLSQIRLLLLGVVDTGGETATASANIDVKMTLGLDGSIATTLTQTWGGSTSLTQYDLTLDVDVSYDGWTYLIVWIRGQDDGALNTSSTGAIHKSGNILWEDTGTSFLSANADATTYFADPFNELDPIALAANWPTFAGAPSGATGDYVPVINEGPTTFDSDSSTVQARALTYLEPVSWAFEATYDADIADNGYVPKQLASMLPNAEVRGINTSRHSTNTEGLATRKKCLHVGPKGVSTPTAQWPTDYNARWPTIYGDESQADMWQEHVNVRRASGYGEISIRALVGAAHIVANVSAPTLPALKQLATVGTWTITATLEQLQGSGKDWSTATAIDTVSEDIEFDHYPTAKGGEWPLWLQIYWSWFHQNDMGKDHYTFREGQLYERDIPLLEPVTLTLDTTGVIRADPMRVNLTAVTASGVPEYNAGTPTERALSRLVLVFPHIGIWEEGVLS